MNKESYDVVGRSVFRVDGLDKLTGKACYAGDIAFPGTLHLKLNRSDRPHAKILGIRTAEAKAHPDETLIKVQNLLSRMSKQP